MKWNQDIGIQITDDIRNIIEACVKDEGGQAKLARKIGLTENVIKTWRGHGSQIGHYIGWAHWEKIKPYFTSRGLIDGSDPRWMTPKEMRTRLLALASAAPANLSADKRRLLHAYRLASAEGRRMFISQAETIISAEKDASSSAASNQ